MNGNSDARFAIITGHALWLRCGFEDATLVDDAVQLAWDGDATPGDPQPVMDTRGAGLAFGPGCRLYHSVPFDARIECLYWGGYDPAHPQRALERFDVIGAAPAPVGGDFTPATPALGGFVPRALACDDDDHLYVLDDASGRVCVFDLPARRLLRTVSVPAGAEDIAWHNGWLYGLSSGVLWRMAANRGVRMLDADLTPIAAPARLDVLGDGRLVVLSAAHGVDAALWCYTRRAGGRWQEEALALADEVIDFASDLAIQQEDDGEEQIVVARRPGEDFVRIDVASRLPGVPLTARGYDGMGIVATPDGRIAYWTERGLRHAVVARRRYRPQGRVIAFRLDAGDYQSVWGRVLLDACVPHGTALALHVLASDDEDEVPRVPRTPPVGGVLAALPEPDATPLPPQHWLPPADLCGAPVFRRSDGSEQPWPAPDEFATVEGSAGASAGRYLWLVLELLGSSQATPRVRTLRAEHPGHDWLRRLPQLYRREEATRDFLTRYLTPLAALHDELALQSAMRHALLKPAAAPTPMLPWLAMWLGLTLDERMSETARRTLLLEAIPFFYRRGTPASLVRLLEIVTGVPVQIIERWRFRGLGQVGASDDGVRERAVVGFGWRVGGQAGAEAGLEDADAATQAYAAYAHRFAVVVQGALTGEMEALVRHLLEVHRPAHTVYELCTVGAGMRIGLGLHLGMTSLIGRSAGFKPFAIGGAVGRGSTVGRPGGGIKPGLAPLGQGRLQ